MMILLENAAFAAVAMSAMIHCLLPSDPGSVRGRRLETQARKIALRLRDHAHCYGQVRLGVERAFKTKSFRKIA